jgi:hypothetical protein
MKSKIIFLLGLFFCLAPSVLRADSITMSLANTCGLPASQLEVEIWNPPGGYAAVNGNSVTVNVPAGTKLSVTQKPGCSVMPGMPFVNPGGNPPCSRMPLVFGPWTPAKNGSTLPVSCMER